MSEPAASIDQNDGQTKWRLKQGKPFLAICIQAWKVSHGINTNPELKNKNGDLSHLRPVKSIIVVSKSDKRAWCLFLNYDKKIMQKAILRIHLKTRLAR